MKKTLLRLARQILRPIFYRLPARWRFAAYSRAIRCESELSSKFTFKLAETREELEACFHLLHDAYVDAATKLLDAQHDPAFNGLYADLKGDLLAQQGKTDEAKKAYRTALEKLDQKGEYRNLVQMKLDALGG